MRLVAEKGADYQCFALCEKKVAKNGEKKVPKSSQFQIKVLSLQRVKEMRC